VKLELGSPPEDGDLYEAFINALYAAGAGKGTIKMYSIAIKEFLEFVKKDPKKVTSDDINRWIIELSSKAKDNRARSVTMRYYVIAVRRFLKWLGVNVKPVMPRARRKEIKALSEEEIQKIYDNARTLRDKLIIRLLVETGMRANELLNISVNDIDFNKKMIRLRVTKNGEERVVFFTDNTLLLIRKYLKNHDGEKLFNMTYQALYKTIRRLGEKVGLNGLRPHMLRHSFATNAIRRGVPLPAVQRILGHKDIKTTQIYTHLILDDLEKAYREAFG
jgi:integrase/recombinase XerD